MVPRRQMWKLSISFLAGCGLIVLAGGITKVACAEDGPADAAKAVAEASPVILLTGFEPFGQVRSPNPSWEGVTLLDGKKFHDYRLVSKQMNVRWGEPLRQLSKWIEAEKPVAVFSFGQGGPNQFAIEIRASNTRGRFPDNDDQLPNDARIVDSGPRHYQGTIDAEYISRWLIEKGYPTRISTRAGQYLCEECLYSLEHLKAGGNVEHVMFCHVPPTNSRVGKSTVTPQFIAGFVAEALEAWRASQRADRPRLDPPNPAPTRVD